MTYRRHRRLQPELLPFLVVVMGVLKRWFAKKLPYRYGRLLNTNGLNEGPDTRTLVSEGKLLRHEREEKKAALTQWRRQRTRHVFGDLRAGNAHDSRSRAEERMTGKMYGWRGACRCRRAWTVSDRFFVPGLESGRETQGKDQSAGWTVCGGVKGAAAAEVGAH